MRRVSTATVLAAAALLLGLGHAFFSIWWALGGTWLLDTVSGGLEERAKSGALLRVVVWTAAVVKLVAAMLPLMAVRGSAPKQLLRPARLLAWVEGGILTSYGIVLTAVGLLVQADVIRAAPDADRRALAWHAYFWDPWFLFWGLLVLLAMRSAAVAHRSDV